MKCVRYSGAGNTFLLIDNRSSGFDPQEATLLCAQAEVDGIIVLEASTCADACMRIFNANGSEAEMCGNGLRCFILFLQECGIHKPKYTVETLGGIQEGWISQDTVSILLATPTDLKLELPYDLYFLNTGVPHAVLFVDSVKNINVDEIGRALRFSPLFAPAGANINFVCKETDDSLYVRTYERGVEAETSACGTGAIASALIAHKILGNTSPIKIHVHSGQTLTVSFNADWSEVILKGPATREGTFELNRKLSIMAPT